MKICDLCEASIAGRNYRNLGSAESRGGYSVIWQALGVERTEGLMCSVCLDKFKKIIRNDAKLTAVKEERKILLSSVKDLPGVYKLKSPMKTPERGEFYLFLTSDNYL